MPETTVINKRQPLDAIGSTPFPRMTKGEGRDANGFCPAHAAFLKQSIDDIKSGTNLVYHDLIENEDA